MRDIEINRYDTIAFLLGIGSSLSVRIVGIVPLSEFIVLLLLPRILINASSIKDRYYFGSLILLLVWIFATVLSNIYNNTSTVNSIKGTFSLVMLFFDSMVAYWIISKKPSSILYFLWGFSISFILGILFGLNAFYNEYTANSAIADISEAAHFHKLIVAMITGIVVGPITIIYFNRSPIKVAIILMLYSLYPLIEGSRSLFLTIFLASGITLYVLNKTNNFNTPGHFIFKMIKKQKFRFIFVLVLFFIFGYFTYTTFVKRGYLGKEELEKYEMQSSSRIGLLSGRGEFVASYFAIKDSPLWGHGSYPLDKNGYGYKAAKITTFDRQLISFANDQIGKKYIPAHSHVLAAWVQSGLLSIFYWILIMGILVKFIFKTAILYPKYFLFSLISSFTIFWSILFSPFDNRLYYAILISFYMILLNRSKIKLNYEKSESK